MGGTERLSNLPKATQLVKWQKEHSNPGRDYDRAITLYWLQILFLTITLGSDLNLRDIGGNSAKTEPKKLRQGGELMF